MLILGLDGLEGLQIGDDIFIGIHYKTNSMGIKKPKISIIAPRDKKIGRINGEEWSKKSGKIYLKELPFKK